MGLISRGFGGRRRVPDELADRVPPGQYVEPGFPVLTAGPTPRLEPEEWATWLDPATGAADVVGLLERRPPGRFTAHPVSTAVSSSRANGPHLLDPVPPEELVGVVDPMTGEVLGGAG